MQGHNLILLFLFGINMAFAIGWVELMVFSRSDDQLFQSPCFIKTLIFVVTTIFSMFFFCTFFWLGFLFKFAMRKENVNGALIFWCFFIM